MTSRPNYCLLVAVIDEALKRATVTLGSHFDSQFVLTLEEAQKLLVSEHFDAIVCNVHFDNNRMFDLLHFAKSHPRTSSLPFLCVLSKPGMLSAAIFESVRMASKALGATDFIPLHDWRTELGDAAAEKRLRQRIRALLTRA
jgi:PleD family two-component response regulator